VDTMALTKAKARLSGLVDRLIHVGTQIVITKHGKPVAVLVPYEEWEKLRTGPSGGLAAAPPAPGELDDEIDRMVEEIYEARTRSKGRKPAL
jgi:prevent-host-death family protein